MTRLPSVFGLVGYALLARSDAQEDWRTWDDCPSGADFDYGTTTEKESLVPLCPTCTYVDDDFELYRRRRQIIEMNVETSTLIVNEDADLWPWLQEEDGADEPVHVITVFGDQKTGKSTMASFLGCAMHEERAFLFPAFGANNRTLGVWASMPYLYQGKKYVILDLPSKAPLIEGYATVHDELLYKVTALLSEVTSIFLYAAGDKHASQLQIDDFNAITTAMETTRADLVWRSEDEPLPPEAGDLRIVNKPALAIITREAKGSDLLNGTWHIDEQRFEADTATIFNLFEQNDPAAALLFNENFVRTTQNNVQAPFFIVPLVEVDTERGNARWNWETNGPYALQSNAACDVFNEMPYMRCKLPGLLGNPDIPHPAPLYHQAVNHLVKVMHRHAVTRMIAEGDGEEQAMFGRRLREIIESGVKEMNSVGPLPRASLWARLMEDRCENEIIEDIGLTFGTRTGDLPVNHPTNPGATVTGQLGQLQKVLDDAVARDEEGLTGVAALRRGRWESEVQKFNDLYNNGDGLAEHVNNFFENRVLLQAVRDECEPAGLARSEVLQLSFRAINNSYAAKYQEYRALAEAARAAELARQLAILGERRWDSAFWDSWEANRILYVGLGIFACIIVGVLSYYFSIAAECCRGCLECCGDYGDKKTEVLIVR